MELNTGRGPCGERLPERSPGIHHDAGQPGDVPPEHAAEDGGERAVRPGPPVPRRGVARVLHERDAAPEPPRLPRPRGADHARELHILPAPLVVAPQRGVPLEQAREEPHRVLFALRLGPLLVVIGGVGVGVVVGGGGGGSATVGEELRRGAEGLLVRERAGGGRPRRRLRWGGGGRGRLGPGFRGGIGRRRRGNPLGGGGGGAVELAALVASGFGFAVGQAGLGWGGGGGGRRAAAPEGVEVEDLLGEATFAVARRAEGPGRPAAARPRGIAGLGSRRRGIAGLGSRRRGIGLEPGRKERFRGGARCDGCSVAAIASPRRLVFVT
ncbi:hypothetical protein SETIT_4G070700v2 [Setaria italica]|uniref:Uncharacterized protein n=1 Tax=Setaria italica TaxID=4555 RepID=A0A368QRW6_SETIT|nr:hypothetical protein SETIT_4G070700v2 [Setaria italica]